jgi:tartrate dehydratase beta subunit/fumarate hydratase class I family protein
MLRYLELPKLQYEGVIKSLKEKGFVCKDVGGTAVLCEKKVNEVQTYKYLIELRV